MSEVDPLGDVPLHLRIPESAPCPQCGGFNLPRNIRRGDRFVRPDHPAFDLPELKDYKPGSHSSGIPF